KQMMYMMPIVTVFIGISLPGGLTLYWLVMSLLTVAQQALFLRRPTPPKIEAHLS
ncbi:YidC/Oxa1 family membrane protein insertase, partial [Patescibacteria group bacterium]|nr:YidC/Oxa1 family membrane protein insertase [Patescibacteria group bacterium]